MFHSGSHRFTLLTVINIPVTTEKTYYFRVNFPLVTLDYCGLFTWICWIFCIFIRAASGDTTVPLRHKLKWHPRRKNWPHSITPFKLVFPYVFFLRTRRRRPKVSGGLTGRWWMDVKGVILDKQRPGPHAATSWKIRLFHQHPREIVWRFHTSFRLHTLSFSLRGTYIIPRVRKENNTYPSYSPNHTNTHALRWHWRVISDTWHREHSPFPSKGHCFFDKLDQLTFVPSTCCYGQINASVFRLISDPSPPRSFMSL